MNHCFACGKDNDQGMKLKFYFDEESRYAICKFRLGRRFTGPPGHAHGGIIATILDEAMGKVNKLRNVIALTKNMNVEYLKPVPLGTTLTVTGREQQVEGKERARQEEVIHGMKIDPADRGDDKHQKEKEKQRHGREQADLAGQGPGLRTSGLMHMFF